MLHAGGLRVDAREVAQFGDEALTGGVVRREGASTRFDHERGNLPGGLADPDQRAAENLRVLAEGRLD